MTGEEYDTNWVPFHRQLFGMKSEDDLPMFAAWFRSLAEFGLAEIRDASLAMASDIATAGHYRTEHLAILRQKIRQRRFERARDEFAEVNRTANRFECQVCQGTGIVPVPHVHCIVDDAWRHPYATMVVSCRCPRGSVQFNAVAAAEVKQDVLRKYRVQMMGLDEYEVLHPDWRRMVHDREQMRRSEDSAAWHAKEADKKNPIDVRSVLKAIGSVPHG